MGDTRTALLRWIKDNPGSSPKAITTGTGLNYDTVRRTLARMANDGQLSADGNSRYRIPGPPVPGVPTVPTSEIPGLSCADTWDTTEPALSQNGPKEPR
jgi:hypothetical protein